MCYVITMIFECMDTQSIGLQVCISSMDLILSKHILDNSKNKISYTYMYMYNDNQKISSIKN